MTRITMYCGSDGITVIEPVDWEPSLADEVAWVLGKPWECTLEVQAYAQKFGLRGLASGLELQYGTTTRVWRTGWTFDLELFRATHGRFARLRTQECYVVA